MNIDSVQIFLTTEVISLFYFWDVINNHSEFQFNLKTQSTAKYLNETQK